jgi:regulator of protease activity HflC (stomatin/prohibitin superfamily)
VNLEIAVQYLVDPNHIKLAFYSMQDPQYQMKSFVEDAIRAIVPTMLLEQLFLEKERISLEIKDDLAKKMTGYGSFIISSYFFI